MSGRGGDERGSFRDPLRGTPYRTVRLLQVGGVSEIFEAAAPSGVRVAVKILRREFAGDREMADRMRIDAEVLSHVQHPNVVRAYEFSKTKSGRPFIVLERLRGRTLHEEIQQRGALPVLEAVDYVRQALQGLIPAHLIGIVHRDIKPANLFVCHPFRGHRVLKVIDFGYAKVLRTGTQPSPVASLVISTADFVGTHRFAAPEQSNPKTAKLVDQRADIYSMGLVFYTLLRGKLPYANLQRGKELLAAQVKKAVEPPSPATVQRLSSALWEILRIALAKDPNARFSGAEEFIAALNDFELKRGSLLDARQKDSEDELPLTARQHAQMTAELEVHPEQARDIKARFGVETERAWRLAQRTWRKKIAKDPKLFADWRTEVDRHRAFVAEPSSS